MAKTHFGKQSLRKETQGRVWAERGSIWRVSRGKLVPPRGRPRKESSLFLAVAEKIPIEALGAVQADMVKQNRSINGVYIAHDSMGYARYVGRGNVFSRLKARFREQPLELKYFSFYIVRSKRHEREVETLLIRAGGPQLHFNHRKRPIDIQPGDIKDFEAGTWFYERQYTRGRKSPS